GRRSVFESWEAGKRTEYYCKLVSIASDYQDIIVGFDLSGDEIEYPNERFKEFAETVKSSNFNLTIHAGETGNPGSVLSALNMLYADRIGHGIGVKNDQSLLNRIAENGIPLELCPTSNLLLGVIPSLEEHPIGDLLNRGVCTTVNTDDPVLFGGTT